MKRLVIIRGIPGSGKSTLAELIAPQFNVSADMWMQVDGKYTFDASRLHYCHKRCREQVEEWMTAGVETIAVANTFTRMS